MTKKIILHRYHTPHGVAGNLVLGSFGSQLCLCDWDNGSGTSSSEKRIEHALKAEFVQGVSSVIENTVQQLDEYFARKRKTFNVPLYLVGTEFQKKVWMSLAGIPYGRTISYADEAAMLNIPKAVRAVANANGANPVSIILPCHRVIGRNGSLTGYGGGLDTKQFLIELEAGNT
ncbi:MAG: methylated-DNA--[protein]-cysteine S-methyltransferase [Prevotellaceae bacterium]|nr:methylated-DNA--[protein]-cysteine S-methyltransferase [Prevotella sp.]MDD7257300.1 methylated-DNA--[protein]-cysteine S-methyltransferase [Prevotellaceae bacterium]MDY6129889.1 methylated-DNA--[protein]-cysteine S-methyltransferase [Prevotella sp.]